MKKKRILFAFLIFISFNSLFSQDKIWDGGGVPGVWEDPLNWLPDGVPLLPNDDVLISGAYSVTVSSNSLIESIKLTMGAALTLANGYTLTVENNGQDGIELEDTGTSLTINGTLISSDHEGSGIDVNEGCTLTIASSGIVTIDNVGYLDGGNGIELSDNMSNSGIITISNTGKSGIRMEGLVPNRSVDNSGTITISSGIYGIEMRSDNWLFTNTGTVTLSDPITALMKDGLNFTNYGTFKGDGFAENGNSNDFIFGGAGSVIAPGTSVGKLTFAEAVNFTNIDLYIEIEGGTTPGIDYDQVVVQDGPHTNGGVTITGASLNLSGSYVPVGGESFMLIEKASPGPITGTFSGLPEGATVNFNGSSFIISYQGGDGNDVGMLFDNPLPVELIDFSAQVMQNEVKLTWATVNEINNDFFTLERSPDGRTFEAIATITGNGTTTEISNYTFMDANPERGLNYYRLKQTDFDGQFSYSDLEIVEFGTDETIKIYPTVVENEITIETGGDLNGELTIIVKDLIGREHLSFTLPSKENKSTFLLNGLTPGSYFVIIYNNETTQTQKIIKL